MLFFVLEDDTSALECNPYTVATTVRSDVRVHKGGCLLSLLKMIGRIPGDSQSSIFDLHCGYIGISIDTYAYVLFLLSPLLYFLGVVLYHAHKPTIVATSSVLIVKGNSGCFVPICRTLLPCRTFVSEERITKVYVLRKNGTSCLYA